MADLFLCLRPQGRMSQVPRRSRAPAILFVLVRTRAHITAMASGALGIGNRTT